MTELFTFSAVKTTGCEGWSLAVVLPSTRAIFVRDNVSNVFNSAYFVF